MSIGHLSAAGRKDTAANSSPTPITCFALLSVCAHIHLIHLPYLAMVPDNNITPPRDHGQQRTGGILSSTIFICSWLGTRQDNYYSVSGAASLPEGQGRLL